MHACQQWQMYYYNQGAKLLTPLKPNKAIRVHQGKTWVHAMVDVKAAETPRSYLVNTTSGQQYRINHKDLLQTGKPPPVMTVPQDDDIVYNTEAPQTIHPTITTEQSCSSNSLDKTIQPPVMTEQSRPPLAIEEPSTTPPRCVSNRIRTVLSKLKDCIMTFWLLNTLIFIFCKGICSLCLSYLIDIKFYTIW